MSKPTRKSNIIITVTMLTCGIVFICPILTIVILSLRFDGMFPTLNQYYELLITNYTFLQYFWNSLFYAVCITICCISISVPLGFLFAKVRFRGCNALFFIYIIAMMLPFQTTLLPNYIQLRDFGLLNTPAALILPLTFSPFAVFMFRQSIKSVSSDLLDYTIIETSSPILLIWYAVLPQIKHAIAAMVVIIFCESWNMIEPVLIFTAQNPSIHPLSVTLGDLPSDVSYSAATVYMIPIILLFMIFKEALQDSMKKFHW